MRREIELEEVLKKSIKDLRIISLKEKLKAKGNPYETYFHLLGKKDAPPSKDANLYFLSMKYRNVMSRKILLFALPVFAVRKCYEDDDNTIIIDIKKKKFWQPRLNLCISEKERVVYIKEGKNINADFIYTAIPAQGGNG